MEDQGQPTPEQQDTQQQDTQLQGKYTDADVDRLKGEARKEARSAAERKFLGALGVENLDDAKAALEDYREKRKAEQSEAERLQGEVEAANKRAEQAEAQAQAREEARQQVLISSAVKDALLNVGVIQNRLGAATRHADFTKASVDEQGNVTGAAEAAEAAKSEVPEFFTDYAAERGGVPPSPQGSKPKKKSSYTPRYSTPA